MPVVLNIIEESVEPDLNSTFEISKVYEDVVQEIQHHLQQIPDPERKLEWEKIQHHMEAIGNTLRLLDSGGARETRTRKPIGPESSKLDIPAFEEHFSDSVTIGDPSISAPLKLTQTQGKTDVSSPPPPVRASTVSPHLPPTPVLSPTGKEPAQATERPKRTLTRKDSPMVMPITIVNTTGKRRTVSLTTTANGKTGTAYFNEKPAGTTTGANGKSTGDATVDNGKTGATYFNEKPAGTTTAANGRSTGDATVDNEKTGATYFNEKSAGTTTGANGKPVINKKPAGITISAVGKPTGTTTPVNRKPVGSPTPTNGKAAGTTTTTANGKPAGTTTTAVNGKSAGTIKSAANGKPVGVTTVVKERGSATTAANRKLSSSSKSC